RKVTLGGTNFIFPNEDWNQMDGPKNLPDADLLQKKFSDRKQRILPDILQGVISGESSGYANNVAKRNALMQFDPISDQLSTADVMIMQLIWMALGALEKITGQPAQVTVRDKTKDGTEAITISWEDAKDYLNLLRAKREDTLPEDDLGNLEA